MRAFCETSCPSARDGLFFLSLLADCADGQVKDYCVGLGSGCVLAICLSRVAKIAVLCFCRHMMRSCKAVDKTNPFFWNVA